MARVKSVGEERFAVDVTVPPKLTLEIEPVTGNDTDTFAIPPTPQLLRFSVPLMVAVPLTEVVAGFVSKSTLSVS